MIKYLATSDEKCKGCMTCTSVCTRLYFKGDNPAQSSILVNPAGNAPEAGVTGASGVASSAGATFHLVACDQECRRCEKECPTQAISRGKSGAILIEKKKCVGCLACVSVCPIGAMRWYPGMKFPFKCVACGACAVACPTQALELKTKEETP
ncbi:MAG: 4Fe-4S binding protein [Spirochaetaceae bacterium]|nr:4Fe-4S binding protein [Spirochaetaceae bacterium]